MSSGQRRQDHFGRRAKREGFAARSVYKLEEIDRRLKLIHPRMRVLDLGAFPGSWMQYTANKVGPGGLVVGIDIQDMPAPAPPAKFIHGDIHLVADEALAAFGPFDVVLSDMAPNTSGQRHADQFRSYELYMRALELAVKMLRAKGTFVGKIFQGAEFDAARKSVAQHFEKVRIFKPEATRSESYEVFMAGLIKRA